LGEAVSYDFGSDVESRWASIVNQPINIKKKNKPTTKEKEATRAETRPTGSNKRGCGDGRERQGNKNR
jgi:hypothetical protein